MNAESQAGRSTIWIAIAAGCALAAIGLGIWAVTTKSDLDDANARIDKLEQQSASEREEAASTEASDVAYGEREKARYRAVRRRLISARREERNLNNRIRVEAGQLQQARADAAAAATEAERRQAELRVAQEERDVAAACARSSIAAISDFFDATTAAAGARAAIRKLEQFRPQCEQALR